MKNQLVFAVVSTVLFAASGQAQTPASNSPAPTVPGSTAPVSSPAASSTAGVVAGAWKIHSAIAGNESDIECTLTQEGATIGGSCKQESGPTTVTGKVDGNKVTFQYSSDYNGTPLTIKYSGTLNGSSIKGDVSVDPFGVGGDFTATKK